MTEAEIQKAIEEDRRADAARGSALRTSWLAFLRRKRNPDLETLPDYGLNGLANETEYYLLDLCAKGDVEYEAIKEEFAAGFQVIPPRSPGPLRSALQEKKVVSLDVRDNYFTEYVRGRLLADRQYKARRAERVRERNSALH